MKHAIYLLLVLSLVFVTGCNRDADESVLAQRDQETYQPGQPAGAEPGAQVDTAPAAPRYNPPAASQQPKPKSPRIPAEPRQSTDNTTQSTDREDRLDQTTDRELEREDPPAPAARPVETVRLPAGSKLTVVMLDRVSSGENAEGDAFTATLADPIIVNGRVLAEKGARVQGRVQNIQDAGKVQGRAQMELVLTRLTTGNRSYNISTEPFVAIAEDTKGRDAATIAGGAGVGAAIGAIAGGKKGAAIGAIIGGGSGTTAVLVTKGKDMTIEPETRVNFVTEESVALPVIRTTAS